MNNNVFLNGASLYIRQIIRNPYSTRHYLKQKVKTKKQNPAMCPELCHSTHFGAEGHCATSLYLQRFADETSIISVDQLLFTFSTELLSCLTGS